MRILVLWADSTSPNLGVRALGAGTEALARRVWPDAEFVFHNYGSAVSPVRLGSPKALAKELISRRGKLQDWLAGFDLVLDTRAGDSFADIYGRERHLAMSWTAWNARRAGIPVILTPQTIGPFDTRIGSVLGRWSMSNATSVMARDSVSAQVAQKLGHPVDVLTTDVVFALDQPSAAAKRDVVLNVSGLLWTDGPHVDAEAYRRVVRELCDRLEAEGREVTLLAHVLRSDNADDDEPAIAEFLAEGNRDLEAVFPNSLEEVREVVAGADLVVGSRMHACLNALSVGTPAIPLAYSRKFEPLLGDLGWPWVIDLRSADKPVSKVLEISHRDDLADQTQQLRARADALLDKAGEHLGLRATEWAR